MSIYVIKGFKQSFHGSETYDLLYSTNKKLVEDYFKNEVGICLEDLDIIQIPDGDDRSGFYKHGVGVYIEEWDSGDRPWELDDII